MKKKILLLTDDIRLNSGISTMAREFVMGTVDKYDWVQLAAAVKHPDQGKKVSVSKDVAKHTGVEDASVFLYPSNGYGDQTTLRQLLKIENPDLILHFTDPRYWIWLYEMEAEVRRQCPLMYYTIWDNIPDPLYNRSYYESCDQLACISKLTYGIVKRLTARTDKPTWVPHEDWQISYVPHGINPKTFYPTKTQNLKLKRRILGDKDYKFIVVWNNRNIKRKQPSDVIRAYKLFCDKLPIKDKNRACLLMHTNPMDNNGTDLQAVKDVICPSYDVIFSQNKLSQPELNDMYNFADVTINLASNEGFGLTTAESLMAGTPVVLNVTGGLQDQIGLNFDRNLIEAEDYVDLETLGDRKVFNDEKFKTLGFGKWAEPVWPALDTLNGSIATPYIFDSRASVEDAATQLFKFYKYGRDECKKRGQIGREWMIQEAGLTSDNMNEQMKNAIDTTIEKWTPRKRYNLYKVN